MKRQHPLVPHFVPGSVPQIGCPEYVETLDQPALIRAAAWLECWDPVGVKVGESLCDVSKADISGVLSAIGLEDPVAEISDSPQSQSSKRPTLPSSIMWSLAPLRTLITEAGKPCSLLSVLSTVSHEKLDRPQSDG